MWLNGDKIWYYLFKFEDDVVGNLEYSMKSADELRENPSMEIVPYAFDCI